MKRTPNEWAKKWCEVNDLHDNPKYVANTEWGHVACFAEAVRAEALTDAIAHLHKMGVVHDLQAAQDRKEHHERTLGHEVTSFYRPQWYEQRYKEAAFDLKKLCNWNEDITPLVTQSPLITKFAPESEGKCTCPICGNPDTRTLYQYDSGGENSLACGSCIAVMLREKNDASK